MITKKIILEDISNDMFDGEKQLKKWKQERQCD